MLVMIVLVKELIRSVLTHVAAIIAAAVVVVVAISSTGNQKVSFPVAALGIATFLFVEPRAALTSPNQQLLPKPPKSAH